MRKILTSLAILALAACSANSGPDVTEVATTTTTASTKLDPPAVSVLILPGQINLGQSADASWDSSGATQCDASGAWHGSLALDNDVGEPTPPATMDGTFSYGVNCSGPGGTTSVIKFLEVGTVPAPTVQLSLAPTAIAPGASATLTWSSTNAISCLGKNGSGSDGWQTNLPTSNMTGFSTGPITTQGDIEYDLTCTGSGGNTEVTKILTVTSAAPPPPPSITFSATPIQILPGGTTSLTWSTTNAGSCAASGGTGSDGWSGAQSLSSTGTPIGPIAAAGIYSYTLSCTGSGGTIAKSIDVVVTPSSVAPAVAVNIDVTPAVIVAGASANLTWNTAYASACVASGSWSGSEPLAGTSVSTGTLLTAGAYSYTLTCSGVGGSGSGTALLTVAPAAATVLNFTANPPAILVGQLTHLSWSSLGATACVGSGGVTGDGWAGAQPVTGNSVMVGPISVAGTAIYTLQCSGAGGSSAPRSLGVVVTNPTPPAAQISVFAVAPSTIQVGQSATLVWATVNAASCTASGGTGAWSGAQATESLGTSTGVINTAGSYTYVLNCTGPGGAALATDVVLNVNPAQSTGPLITAFAVTPGSIEVGQSALLSWVTVGATACTASGGTGAWSGTVATSSIGTSTGVINSANDYTYTLTCTGSGTAGVPSSVALNVTSAPPPAATISGFIATPNSVLVNQSTTLSWSSTSATSCAATGGAGSDGWTGSVPVTDLAFSVGPLGVAGNYVYTLTCTGPGGASAPSSLTVDVASAPPPPTINSFTLSLGAVLVGQSVTATWSSTGATSCAATGGTGSDGWDGTVATASIGSNVGPLGVVGTVTYTLTCTGPGGTSAPTSVTVVVSPTAPPATVTGFTLTPPAIQTGHAASLAWTTANATRCTASGGTGTDGWDGSTQPTSSIGVSTGNIATANIYTYTLTCSGAGGASLPAAAVLMVTTAIPTASIQSFTAAPTTLQLGQSTTLVWATSSATACTASGGTGTDGWGGLVAAQSSGTPVGPFNAAGNYVYTLTCTGLGGSSAPSSVSVTVTPALPAATIVSFTATPTSVTAGQSVSLAWTTSHATSCTASGGTGSDGWSGAMAASSTGQPFATASPGTVTYTLACLGSGGSSTPSSVNVTVNAVAAVQPTVTLNANGVNPLQIQPGTTPMLSWTSTNATACTASGGAGGWSGTKPTSSSGVAVTAISTPGVYSYTLTCTGAGGSGSSTVQITVVSSASYDCGIPNLATTALVAPAATVTTSKAGLCVADCTVTNPGNAINSNPNNYASMFIALGLGGSETLDVADTATFPAGRQAGFVIASGTNLINLSLLQGITLQTLLGGTVQETATTSSLLTLQAAGLLSVDPTAGFAGFTTTKPFNGVQLVAGSVLALDSNLKVYSACVSLH